MNKAPRSSGLHLARWLLIVICSLPHLIFCASPDDRTHAMWVYKTEALLEDPQAQATLFAFCKSRQITDLFWQTHFIPAPQSDTPGSLTFPYEAKLHPFLSDATAQGLRIHALMGDPAHTNPEKHHRILTQAQAILTFNQNAPPNARFFGLHSDIEPHGLKAWKTANPAQRNLLLTQLVDVSKKLADLLHAADPPLAFGADLTWWFDKSLPDGTPAYPVTFNGITKDATRHLLDFADNIGIMSYRNTTEGRNGITALVKKAITYADTARGRVFVGVKMANIGPASESYFGSTETIMQQSLLPLRQTYAPHRGYAGIAYFMYEAYQTMPK